jgi:hypothetical protein
MIKSLLNIKVSKTVLLPVDILYKPLNWRANKE